MDSYISLRKQILDLHHLYEDTLDRAVRAEEQLAAIEAIVFD
jgi:hypothetical protein